VVRTPSTGRACDHTQVVETAVLGPFEFDGGRPPPVPAPGEEHLPAGHGYVLVYIGTCSPGCDREVYRVVVQRYNDSARWPGRHVVIPWTTGEVDPARPNRWRQQHPDIPPEED